MNAPPGGTSLWSVRRAVLNAQLARTLASLPPSTTVLNVHQVSISTWLPSLLVCYVRLGATSKALAPPNVLTALLERTLRTLVAMTVQSAC